MGCSDRCRRGEMVGLRLSAALLLVLAAGGAQAQAGQDTPGAGGQGAAPGSDTRQWLDLQRGGSQASPNVQRLPEAARTRALERYLESFGHPIPEDYFDRERFGVR